MAISASDVGRAASDYRFVLLAGGVGGAKLAAGLARLLPPERLTIIVNTGDDFQHLGLTICPDLDTVLYRLAGVHNDETGWGRAGEHWRTIDEVARLGGPAWFRLGDLDLATHLLRAEGLAAGRSLTAVTADLGRRYGVAVPLLPMTDQPAPTLIVTDEGTLPFQTWFVERRWQPVVREIRLPTDVRATAAVARALERADFILIAPSNPFVSIDPILNVFPIREVISDLPRAVVAVSPIVGGAAVKGPAAELMRQRGLPVSPSAVAEYYGDLLDGFVYDQQDAGASMSLPTRCVDTMMTSADSSRRVAADTVALALELGGAPTPAP